MGSVAPSLTNLVETRHSTRAFKPDPVPRETLEECFRLAQLAASNSNLQPWRLTVVQGEALKRLENRLIETVASGKKPTTAPIPDAYRKYRSDMGHALYGPKGYNIGRGVKEDMEKARLRNYNFFDAPTGCILSLDKSLADVDILSAGLYLQTLVFLLKERGVSSCIEVSVAGYPDEIREELGIPANMNLLCGLAIDYEDEKNQVNKLIMDRDQWQDSVKFVEV